jgi:hypothetical protein
LADVGKITLKEYCNFFAKLLQRIVRHSESTEFRDREGPPDNRESCRLIGPHGAIEATMGSNKKNTLMLFWWDIAKVKGACHKLLQFIMSYKA